MTRWTIFIQYEYEDESGKVYQSFDDFNGSVAEAQVKAEHLVKAQHRVTEGYWKMGGPEFTDKWNPNTNYGDQEVYSRSYGVPNPDMQYLVSYVFSDQNVGRGNNHDIVTHICKSQDPKEDPNK